MESFCLSTWPLPSGVQPGILQGALHGGDGQRTRPEGIFVRRQLDDVADAELTLEFFDGFAGHVRRERAHMIDSETAWEVVPGTKSRS